MLDLITREQDVNDIIQKQSQIDYLVTSTNNGYFFTVNNYKNITDELLKYNNNFIKTTIKNQFENIFNNRNYDADGVYLLGIQIIHEDIELKKMMQNKEEYKNKIERVIMLV